MHREKELLKDKDQCTEYLTDEILSMMLFNDIHDCSMHPVREANFIDYFKDKYPFNRDLGIDTSIEGTNKYLNLLIEFLKDNHLETLLHQLKLPIAVDPLKELKNLQALDDFYNDDPHETDQSSSEYEKNTEGGSDDDNGNILPNELFYEFEETRKSENYSLLTQCDNDFTEEEVEDKVKCTFIHDKVVFDTFNIALNLYNKRREEIRPWRKHSQAAYDRPYSQQNIIDLLEKSRLKVNEWLNISAGTRKIPPPPI